MSDFEKCTPEYENPTYFLSGEGQMHFYLSTAKNKFYDISPTKTFKGHCLEFILYSNNSSTSGPQIIDSCNSRVH